jgi:hypothetical protein
MLASTLTRSHRVSVTALTNLRWFNAMFLAGIGISFGLNAFAGGSLIRSAAGLPLVVTDVVGPGNGIDYLNGGQFEISIKLTNTSLFDITILGCTSGFPAHVQSLPVRIPPGSSKTVRILARKNPLELKYQRQLICNTARHLRENGEIAAVSLANARQAVVLTTDASGQAKLPVFFPAPAAEQVVMAVQQEIDEFNAKEGERTKSK